MKAIKSIAIMFVGLFSIVSCNINDPIEFQQKDINISFDTQNPIHKFNGTVSEDAGKLYVPVVLAGIKGKAVSVEVEVHPTEKTPAIEGVDYEIKNKTLTFPEGFGILNLEVDILDNSIYEGNKTFMIVLKPVEGLKQNTSSSVLITIIDDEHPLKHLLGTYTVASKNEDGEIPSFEVEITPDMDGDVSVLWIENFPYMAVPGTMKFKCVVVDETSFYIPYQEFASTGYGPFYLGNMTAADPTTKIQGTINGTTFTISDSFGTVITEGNNEGLTFFIVEDVVLTKK